MSKRHQKIFWPSILLIAMSISLLLLAARAGTIKAEEMTPSVLPPTASASPSAQSSVKPETNMRARLAQQPAAFKLARKLGKRFSGSKHATTVLQGTLRRGTDEQHVRFMRRQTDDGETVEVAVGQSPASLIWSTTEGATASGSPASQIDKLLLERLVFDSPDGFILAQIRGASYQTIIRNVRPAEAAGSDDYTGPLWDIIEVKEPANPSSTDAQSNARLYWLNTSTGMIDKIVSREDQGEVIATLSNWVNQRGELVPLRVTWTSEGRTLMQLDLTGFNYLEQQSQQ